MMPFTSSTLPTNKFRSALDHLFSSTLSRWAGVLAVGCLVLLPVEAHAQTTVTFSTAGSGTWVCPAGVTSATVACWGGGGGGGGGINGANPGKSGAGGGGGGAYALKTFTVTPGNSYSYTVGAGGSGGIGAGAATSGGSSSFTASSTLTAGGGSPGTSVNGASLTGAGGAGGTASSGSTNYSGGSGATGTSGSSNYGGGGGSSAGTGSNGNNGSTTTSSGGAAPTGGGAGGNGPTSSNSGNAGSAPGGGGSGADSASTTSRTGGAGGVGQITITYTAAAPTITVMGTLSSLVGNQGTASAPASFSVSGNNLTADISVSAPTGFEISTSSGSGYASSLNLTQSSGTVSSTTIYVRLTAADTAGSYSGNVTLASTGATTQSLSIPTSFVVTPFTQGNLAVEQLATNATSSTFSIVEVNPSVSGTTSPVNTFPVPYTGSSAMRQSSAGTTGRLANSNDGTLLAFTGFLDPTGVVDETTIAARGAASLSQSFQYTLTATYTGTSGNQTRSATTLNNTTWYMGDKGGIYLNGSSTPANTTNVRPLKSFGGTVYALSQNTSAVLSSVSISGTTVSSLSGLPADASAVDFYMLSSGVNGSAFDLLYVLDGSYITKYSLVGTNWVTNSTGTTAAIGVAGDSLCASSNGTGANLYVTTGTGTTVVKVTDTAGYNAAPSINTANNVTLYTASSGAYLKGVSFAPLAAALPDLTLGVSAPSASGPNFTYTVTVGNSGAANASGVNFQLVLPTGVTFVSAADGGSFGSGGFTVPTSATTNVMGQQVVSFTNGTVNAGNTDNQLTVVVSASSAGTYKIDGGSTSTVGDGYAEINTTNTTTTPIAESSTANNYPNVTTSTSVGPASIGVTGTPSSVSTSFGVASSPTTFSVSGANLRTDITVTAPTGFEISTSASTGYSGTLTLTQSSGTVSATTLYVRLAATTTAGSYSGNVSLSSTGASTVNVAIPSSTVSPSANLSGIGLSTGSLTQAFAATTTNYTEYVSSGVTSLTVTPAADSGATVTVNGASASTPVSLSTGSNTISINVTASGGGSSQTYTLTVIRAGAFTTGDLVVTTYGNTAVAPVHLDGQTTLITLEEFSPTIASNSSAVMAVVLPGAASGSNVGITGEYGSSSEGKIQQTADGRYLTFGGYSAAQAFAFTTPVTTALAQSPCATVPRVAALVDINSNSNTSSVFNDIYNTNNPRCVYSPDDTNIYLSGQAVGIGDQGGLYYTQVGVNTVTGGTAPTGVFNGESTRVVQGFGGDLYYSADQNNSKGVLTGLFKYSGLPTTTQSGTGTVIVPANNGSGINYSPDGFYFANATTLYVADTGVPKAGGTGNGGIEKWVYNGSQWVLKYTLTNPSFVAASAASSATHGETGFESITGKVVGGVAYLYAVSYTAGDADSDGLYGITDTISATSASGTFTEIASAPGLQASGTNPDYVFKGVSFAPTALPLNTSMASNVTSSGATLNGTINPNGTDTQVYFQYGTTTAYGSTTATQDIGSGTSPVAFSSASLTGLLPGTTYNYQLVTVSNGLTSTYANQTFTTPADTSTTPSSDTPTMPQWGLIVMALLLIWVAMRKRQGDAVDGLNE